MSRDHLELLGMPYEVCNCADAVRRMFALRGVELPEEALTLAGAGMWERVADRWTEAARPLDVIASDPRGLGCESHVSVVIDTDPPTVLSSSRADGVHISKPWHVQRQLAVYRWRGVA